MRAIPSNRLAIAGLLGVAVLIGTAATVSGNHVREVRPSERLKRLLKERYEAAQVEFDGRFKEFLAGRGTQEFLYRSACRLLQAQKELSDKPAEQRAALEAHLKRMKEIEEIAKGRYDAGRIPIQDYQAARYWRLEAEIWLERAGKTAE